MNLFLEEFLGVIGIDLEYLHVYLASEEIHYLNSALKSIDDLHGDFYTDNHGQNLETLLHFLSCHLEEVTAIWEDRSRKDILVTLYMSRTISGDYDCFHFDLSKFELTYESTGEELTLYRVGRATEIIESLGNSWAKDSSGLRSYITSSSIEIENRPIFEIKINDTEVLCSGNTQESELILQKNFKCNEVKLLNAAERLKLLTHSAAQKTT